MSCIELYIKIVQVSVQDNNNIFFVILYHIGVCIIIIVLIDFIVMHVNNYSLP